MEQVLFQLHVRMYSVVTTILPAPARRGLEYLTLLFGVISFAVVLGLHLRYISNVTSVENNCLLKNLNERYSYEGVHDETLWRDQGYGSGGVGQIGSRGSGELHSFIEEYKRDGYEALRFTVYGTSRSSFLHVDKMWNCDVGAPECPVIQVPGQEKPLNQREQEQQQETQGEDTSLSKASVLLSPHVYIFSLERGIALLPNDLFTRHNFTALDIAVYQGDACFGSHMLAWFVHNVVGYDVIVTNWVISAFEGNGFLLNNRSKSLYNLNMAGDFVSKKGVSLLSEQLAMTNNYADDDISGNTGHNFVFWPKVKNMVLDKITNFLNDLLPSFVTVARVESLWHTFLLRTGFDSSILGHSVRWTLSVLTKLYQYLVFRIGVLFSTAFIFFISSTLMSFTLRETQHRMLSFTYVLQFHIARNRPIYEAVLTHVRESVIFVPIVSGFMFFLFNFYSDQLLSFLVTLVLWGAEIFSLLSLRSHMSLTFYPKIFLCYFSLWHIYFFSSPFGFLYPAVFVLNVASLHAMMYFWNVHEVSAFESGVVTATCPRARVLPATAGMAPVTPAAASLQEITTSPPRTNSNRPRVGSAAAAAAEGSHSSTYRHNGSRRPGTGRTHRARTIDNGVLSNIQRGRGTSYDSEDSNNDYGDDNAAVHDDDDDDDDDDGGRRRQGRGRGKEGDASSSDWDQDAEERRSNRAGGGGGGGLVFGGSWLNSTSNLALSDMGGGDNTSSSSNDLNGATTSSFMITSSTNDSTGTGLGGYNGKQHHNYSHHHHIVRPTAFPSVVKEGLKGEEEDEEEGQEETVGLKLSPVVTNRKGNQNKAASISSTGTGNSSSSSSSNSSTTREFQFSGSAAKGREKEDEKKEYNEEQEEKVAICGGLSAAATTTHDGRADEEEECQIQQQHQTRESLKIRQWQVGGDDLCASNNNNNTNGNNNGSSDGHIIDDDHSLASSLYFRSSYNNLAEAAEIQKKLKQKLKKAVTADVVRLTEKNNENKEEDEEDEEDPAPELHVLKGSIDESVEMRRARMETNNFRYKQYQEQVQSRSRAGSMSSTVSISVPVPSMCPPSNMGSSSSSSRDRTLSAASAGSCDSSDLPTTTGSSSSSSIGGGSYLPNNTALSAISGQTRNWNLHKLSRRVFEITLPSEQPLPASPKNRSRAASLSNNNVNGNNRTRSSSSSHTTTTTSTTTNTNAAAFPKSPKNATEKKRAVEHVQQQSAAAAAVAEALASGGTSETFEGISFDD